MTPNSSTDSARDHCAELLQAAAEIRAEGHNGWGNACADAAEHIAASRAEVERLRAALQQADSVLRVIEEQDAVENCLDPQWAARIAKSARDALSTKKD